jgi:hypothetical protein
VAFEGLLAFAGMAAREDLLSETRQVMGEARGLLGGDHFPPSPASTGVIGLYEALCHSLEEIEPERVRALLGRLSQKIAALSELERDVELVRRLRDVLREG